MRNNAPFTKWFSTELGNVKRQRLYVNGQETRYFIDTALASYTKTYGERHGLYGSGMSESGCAGVIDFGPHIAKLKQKAEQLAFKDMAV